MFDRTDKSLFELDGCVNVFFRIDDITCDEQIVISVLEIINARSFCAELAVIPFALDRMGISSILEIIELSHQKINVHQHGYKHLNYERCGKRSEFGDCRRVSCIERDLIEGDKILRYIFDAYYLRMFTPPWNRCNRATQFLLKKNDYLAVSMFQRYDREVVDVIPEVSPNIDWEKLKNVSLSFRESLDAAIEHHITLGRNIGIMLHPNRMEQSDLYFLRNLLDLFLQRDNVVSCGMLDMAGYY